TRMSESPDGFKVDGQKLWTSGATLADWIIVLVRSAPIERSPIDGITMLLLPARAPGITVRRLNTLGNNGLSSCEIFFENVAAGPDAVLGELHRGMRQVFATVNREGLNAAAATLGVGRGALELAVEYSRERKVFGRPIGSFQVPQHWMVDAAVTLES